MGDFGKWVSVIVSILAFHGIHDLLGNREEFVGTMDDDRDAWAAFMAHWAASGTLKRTLPELVSLALNDNGSACPIKLDSGPEHVHSRATKLGGELAKLRDQRFGEYILRRRRGSGGVRTWYLAPADGGAD